MQVAVASTEKNTAIATISVELLPISRCWKKASAVTPATHPAIKTYRTRFIDLLAVCDDEVGYGAARWPDRPPGMITAGISTSPRSHKGLLELA
jgi:hypothetical protein